MDWEKVKETARRYYERFASFFLFQNLILYLVACVAAGRPVGVHGYATFVFHVFRWRRSQPL